jgi:hypothetical protein
VKIELPILFLALFFLVMVAVINVLLPALVRSAGPLLISLEVTDETLEKTLNQVSEISGYTIDLQSSWYDLPVTVHLLNVPLEQAIPRILDNRVSYAITWNDTEKSISITISEISQKKRDPVENKASGDHGDPRKFGRFHKQLPGQGIKFKQASHTADY